MAPVGAKMWTWLRVVDVGVPAGRLRVEDSRLSRLELRTTNVTRRVDHTYLDRVASFSGKVAVLGQRCEFSGKVAVVKSAGT